MTQEQTTPDRTPAGWGNVADAYDTDVAPTMTQYAQAAMDATDLRPDQQVLDVAAGSGALALEAARRGAQVTAIDFAPEMIARLQTRADQEGLQVDAQVMDGQALEFPDASFDRVYSNMGLMFFPSPDAGMKEMRRVLRDGGQVGIVTWNVPERSEMFKSMFDALEDAVPDLPPPPEPPAVYSLADPDDLARRMETAGFHDVAVQQVVRYWTHPTPEIMWDAFVRSNPVIPGILRRVGDDKADAVRTAFLERVRPMAKDGQVSLSGEAHMATGRT